MAHHIDARYDEQDHMFIPPIRTLGFNPQLTLNDSLLVQSYIEAYDISYPEALRRIEAEVEELRSHLETDGSYELNDIGLLQLNEEGKLEFEPCESGILTPELYGLSSFEMPPLVTETPQADADKAQEVSPREDTITIKMSWLRNAVAVAAAIIAFLMISTPVSNSDKMSAVQQSGFINVAPTHHAESQQPKAAAAEAVADVPAPIQEAEAEPAPSEPAPPAPAAQPEEAHYFCLAMASQVTEKNAKTFIGQLSDKGFTDGRILVSGAKKIRRVVYGTYATEAEAVSALKALRKESRLFKDTWVLEVK